VEKTLIGMSSIKGENGTPVPFSSARVPNSKSKAQNLEFAMEHMIAPDVSHIVIFDADHWPRVDTVATLLKTIVNSEYSAVQGAVLVERGGYWWFRYLVDGMEWTSWNFWGPGFSVITGSAYFGGGNAVWKRDALTGLGFDASYLTEDIDVSIRALSLGHTIQFVPWASVGELCPATLEGFYRQRLRWSMGWEQVTLARANMLFSATKISEPKKWRIFLLLVMRYWTAVTSVVAIGSFVGTFLYTLVTGRTITFPEPTSVALQVNTYNMVFAVLGLLIVLYRNREPLSRWVGVFAFLPISAAYFAFQLVLFAISWVRFFFVGVGAWVPTARAYGQKTIHLDMEREASKGQITK